MQFYRRTDNSINTKSAFTLIEIILVVVILSVLAALAVPNFSKSYAQVQMKNSVYDLASFMRYAQSLSVIQSSSFRLQVDVNRNMYWLEKKEESSEDFKLFTGRMGGEHALLSNISIEPDKEEIFFYPDGRIDKMYIYLCRADFCYTISTKEQRGFVHVFEGKL